MQIRDRDKAIANMEALLQKLSEDPKSGVQFVPNSRWMAIFKETAFQGEGMMMMILMISIGSAGPV